MKNESKNKKHSRRVKNIPGMSQILIDFKPERCNSNVYINQKMDVTNLYNYVQKKKKTNKDITLFHAFLTGIGKIFYNRPYLNRYITNRHVYEHTDVNISFVAKVSFDDKSEEIMIIIKVDEDDTIDSISKKIKAKVDEIRKGKKIDKKGANNALDIFGKMPNPIRIPLVGIFKWLDKKNILPKSLIEDNLYYSSLIVSDLGTFKCGAIYHNITNFGTSSGLVTIGEVKDEVVMVNGKKEIKKTCEFGINLDERIADGYYFIKSMQLLEYIYSNPELLEDKANEKVEIKK